MITLKVKANGSGRVVNWLKFKKGILVDQSRISFTPTTVLTDAITDIYSICKSLDNNCEINIINPNGFTSASFDIAIIGKGYKVNCSRRLTRGLFPLNPLAAEFGSNYDVVFSIETESTETEEKLTSKIKSTYTYTEINQNT